MEYTILLVVILVLPAALSIILKVSASALFFAVMSGELLGRYFGHDAERAIKLVSGNDTVAHFGEAILLLLPVILTAIVMRGTLPKNKAVLHLVPALIAGLVLAAFLLPVLPVHLQESFRSTPYGAYVFEANSAIIGAIVLAHLILLWLFDRGKHGKKHHKKHH